MWRKENDRKKKMGKRGRKDRGNRDAVGHLFEHKYLCQHLLCQGTNYVESAQLCSSKDRRGRRQREQTEISWASIHVFLCNLLCIE